MNKYFDVLIVGGGHAGAQVAVALRQEKYSGTIGLLSTEQDLPYERPPLSKEYLSGQRSSEQLLLRPPTFWLERQVTMLLGRRVDEVIPTRHAVRLADDSDVSYGKLIWAAGGRARILTCTGHHLAGVHCLRTRSDTDDIVRNLAAAREAVIVGGGYVGLEVAAVLIERGLRVTVIEAADRVLARVAGAPLSRFYEARHRNHGVDIRLGAGVVALEERDGRVAGARLADGQVVPADLVIVGIGIIPIVEPLLEAGAQGGNGVWVDERCQTSLDDIYAIGDCALQANLFAGGAAIRLESVPNANEHANTVARVISGGAVGPQAVPWFWSNQYDLKLQTVGLSLGHDAVVTRGNPSTGSFSVVYLKERRVIALDCVNAGKDFIQGKSLVAQRLMIEPEQLADERLSLKELAAGAQASA